MTNTVTDHLTRTYARYLISYSDNSSISRKFSIAACFFFVTYQ